MPTQILEGPRSDPRLKAPTDPFTPPPLTKVRPRPLARPEPVVAPRRRRGRLAAVLAALAVAGAAAGGALAWWEVSSSGPALPTAGAALASVRGSGDYVGAPFTDTVSVERSVPVEVRGGGCDIPILCDILGGDDERDMETQEYRAAASITASVALTEVRHSDVTLQRRSVSLSIPAAVLGAPYVDPASIEAVDGDSFEGDRVDDGDIVDEAESIIEREALRAGVLRDAQRDVRQLLVERLHRAGFRHVHVRFV